MIRRILLTLVLPLALILAAQGLSQQADDLAGPWLALRQYGALLGLLTALILCWVFNQTRVLFVLLALGLGTLVLQWDAWPGPAFLPPVNEPGYLLVAHLLPVNLIVFPLLKERGLLTARGIARLAAVVVQPILALYLGQWFPEQLEGWLTRSWLPALWLGATPIPQSALLLFLVAGFLVAFSLARDQTAVGIGYLATLAGGLAVLHSPASPATGQLVLFAASLNVVLGVILRSYQMAYRDELTGLPARRALWEQLQKLGARFSIAMVDIDHFKKFNDRHGHDVGDQVLRMVASHLARVRGGGRAFRYGGEEFALLFPGKLGTEAEPFAEALRQSVADARFRMRGRDRARRKPSKQAAKKARASSKSAPEKALRVTVSIGLADSGGPADTRREVLKHADKALYRAKRRGRNRVES